MARRRLSPRESGRRPRAEPSQGPLLPSPLGAVQPLVQTRVDAEDEREGSHQEEEGQQNEFHALTIGALVDKRKSSYD